MPEPIPLHDYVRDPTKHARPLVIDLKGERLPAAMLGTPIGFAFVHASTATTAALARLGLIASSERMPFTVVTDANGVITITVERLAGRSETLENDASHLWLTGLIITGVAVDCAAIEHINSHIVAWLLQIAHAAKPVALHLINVGAQPLTQLRQLRLDHLFVICS